MPGVAKTGEGIYIYDGSFPGLLCCIYNLYYNNVKPAGVATLDNFSSSLYQNIEILTVPEQARRVQSALEEKIYPGCTDFLFRCYLSALDEKEMKILSYVEKGFSIGEKIRDFLTDEDVNILFRAVRSLNGERNHYLGIVRFYKSDDVYISKINPKGSILPLIGGHFAVRFKDMDFMIYDETHRLALVRHKGKYDIIRAENISFPSPSIEERRMIKLWKQFYDTIAIEQRENPKLRMNYLPKYQWKNLPELEE